MSGEWKPSGYACLSACRVSSIRCENCRIMAPRMKEIEEQFKNQINFIVVDGSSEKNYDLVSP